MNNCDEFFLNNLLNLVTSEHNQKPKFMAWLAALLQPFADQICLQLSMPNRFDVDIAVGDQLDQTGKWIGLSRFVPVPLEGVYFSWDIEGVGWDQGIWWTQYDPLEGLTRLTDPLYRLLLYAKIGANHWDGSVPAAYAIYNEMFKGQPFQTLIQDNGNMTMTIAFLGQTPDVVTKALITSGVMLMRPNSVGLAGNSYFFPSVPNTPSDPPGGPDVPVPFFGFDAENGSIAGWDVGAWGLAVAPTPPAPGPLKNKGVT